jgi:hypothetical protein
LPKNSKILTGNGGEDGALLTAIDFAWFLGSFLHSHLVGHFPFKFAPFFGGVQMEKIIKTNFFWKNLASF